ncbi:Methyltransferase domain protein [anaerobic digester metagenome]
MGGIDEDLIKIICLIDQFQNLEKIFGPLTEIGVHHGKTLIFLGLLAKENERTIGIDIFEDLQDQNLDLSGCGSYAKLLSNIAVYAPYVKFEIVCSNSYSILPETMRKISETRIFHIDGGHYIEVVLNDLAIAQKNLHLGGVIIVDDYWHSGFPEVQEAVNKYFRTSESIKAVPFAVGKNKIFLVGISYKQRILNWFKKNLPEEQQKIVKVLGYEAICLDRH